MDTYDFVADWVARRAGRTMRVLDYGCGAGQIVQRLRTRGINASGCDVFYEGGNLFPNIPADLRPYIQRMQGDRIPFADASFDFVVSNQVLEHVPDLDMVAREIARVLKPGGIALNVFPDKGVWREGHCGIPFLHWFPKQTAARVYYAAAMRVFGMGSHKQDLSPIRWARQFCRWLDDWCHYRSLREIRACFAQHFRSLEHLEEQWLHARLRPLPLPVWLQRWFVRKMAGLVIELRK